MYVRTSRRKNKDGTYVEYLQLAHNVRVPGKGYCKADVVYNFGRKDELDLQAIQRLVKSLSRFLSPEDALEAQANADISSAMRFIRSASAGGALLLRGLWQRLTISQAIRTALKPRNFSAPVEDALFALVANRALAPSSKLAVEEWAQNTVCLGNEQPIQLQHLYRAMDFLLEHQEGIQKNVFWATANLLNLAVDLIFFDTTNVYFETEDVDASELKARGNSKEKRFDLPLVTIGLAVTREGIPVKCWVLPGNQHDAKCVEQVQRELSGWKLNRIIWVMDRGMTSEENKRILQRAGGDYILGEKLRGNEKGEEALARGGRYKTVAHNMHVKEVFIGQNASKRRYVVVYNPSEAARDQKHREKHVNTLQVELEEIAGMSDERRSAARQKLLQHPVKKRYVKELKNGHLALDKAKIKADAKLDGKYLLSSSNDDLSTEDIALGYKQLLQVERAFRTMKSTLEVRPVYHRKDDRIRSHVLLCWLALLLVRVLENETGLPWNRVRKEMQQMHLGEFLTEKNRLLRYTDLTNGQRNIFKKLKIKPPRTIKSIEEIK